MGRFYSQVVETRLTARKDEEMSPGRLETILGIVAEQVVNV